MKFALFEFDEDKSCAVGESEWIIGQDDSFDYEDWVKSTEVLVNWPKQFKDYLKWSNKSGKCSIDPECEMNSFVARILKFSDEYNVIHGFMKTYLDTGSTKTPVRGRGMRTTKKNSRYTDDGGDSYECEELQTLPPKKKAKKKILPSNSTMTQSHIQHLREKIANEEDKEDISEISTSSSEMEDDSKEIAKLKRLLAKREEEIKELKSILKNKEEMRSFSQIVDGLKESADYFKRAKLLQDGKHSPSNQTKMRDSQLLVLENVRPPSPALSCTSQATTSSSTSSEMEADNVTICPNVLVAKGQNTILSNKATAKDFVYAIMGMLWTREVLSTHSVTGRKSNAHKDANPKPQLDAQKVESICAYVSKKYDCTSSAVRQHMTTKINNVVKCCKMRGKKTTESSD